MTPEEKQVLCPLVSILLAIAAFRLAALMTSSPRHRHPVAAIAIAGMLCACTMTVRAEWLVDVSAGAAYNSNLTRAERA